jgi:hypothetical protein
MDLEKTFKKNKWYSILKLLNEMGTNTDKFLIYKYDYAENADEHADYKFYFCDDYMKYIDVVNSMGKYFNKEYWHVDFFYCKKHSYAEYYILYKEEDCDYSTRARIYGISAAQFNDLKKKINEMKK